MKLMKCHFVRRMVAQQDGEDKEIFDRLYNLLSDIEDVSQIYTNVSNIG